MILRHAYSDCGQPDARISKGPLPPCSVWWSMPKAGTRTGLKSVSMAPRSKSGMAVPCAVVSRIQLTMSGLPRPLLRAMQDAQDFDPRPGNAIDGDERRA